MTQPFPSLAKAVAAGCLSLLLAAAALRAQDPSATPTTTPPAATPAAAVAPTDTQRIGAMEAYFTNSDPTAALKGSDGKIPDGLTTPAIGVPGPGHNAWMMASAALVLFMTLPGLALFYGGLVRRKNVLSVCAQCLGCAGLVTILWWAVGYSLVFGKNFNSAFLGGSEHFFLNGVTSAPNTDYSYWVSENVFSMYQLMFAIITPALIVGAIAERMKFTAIMTFIALWMFLVYFPLAHMVWGATGLMNGTFNADAKITALDFAGGTVVHMSSGWSALILCLILGKRLGFGKQAMPPHSMVLCMVGTGMLWVGWYGFNAGSAVAADGIAANAFMTTTIATAVAAFVWPTLEFMLKGKPSILGYCSGAVAGLVVVTPACGYINATGAVIIGVCAGLIPYFFVVKVKAWFGYDDALDTFGVHAVGGTMGALLTGFLATSAVNSNLAKADPANPATTNHLFERIGHTLWLEQLKAIALTLVLAVVATLVLGYVLKMVMGLRPTEENEDAGLDITDHGEEGYHDVSNEGYGHASGAYLGEAGRPQMSSETVGTINA
ncbi:MAG: ammonium transporter [Gluconacetobacter diazotrophicus]|nr:ammonium transporter [Gluconacetobacter diazotrophicus]